MDEYEFDVALSYAGEDQDLVLPVFERLKAAGVEVFHDRDHEAEQWGLDLVEYFSEAFSKRARYVLLFGSTHYNHKWARLQYRTALGRALEQHTEYVLPIRIDDTEIPGLSQNVGYLDLRVHDAETVANAVVQKLAQHRAEFTVQAPLTPKTVSALAREKPQGWEYLLYVTVVAQGLTELEPKYWEHFLGYAPRNGTVEQGSGIALIRDRNVVLSEIIKVAVEAVFTAETQEAAFGRPGTPGHADRIVHLGGLFVRTFDEILEWAREIRGTSYANEHARAAAFVQAQFADQQLKAMYTVAEELRDVADTLVERLAAGEPINLTVPLVFEIEPALELEFKAALDRLSR
ncbi:toll/interleukin-1 receptor domain-containing protein [Lentzea sp. HUAS TT2]|uniref:toll/interleukin-1 receptor domain-containing protein n=1 Tax=Lentzea sp. HUAS TT2 TaxID=3447454 RepID=UPI003F6FA5C7